MRGTLRVVCAVAVGLLSAAAPARSQELAMKRLAGLGEALQGAPVWAAEFSQVFTPAGMTFGEEAAGRIWLAWPDRAVFHTGSPPSRLMGLEGRVARLVDLEAETCDEHRLSDREWERVPLAAVLDPSGALERFTVADLGDRGFVLMPREVGGVDRVEVAVGTDGLPREVVIVDPQGAVNRLRFSDWRVSDGPPDGTWLPVPPAGVECVVDPGPLE